MLLIASQPIPNVADHRTDKQSARDLTGRTRILHLFVTANIRTSAVINACVECAPAPGGRQTPSALCAELLQTFLDLRLGICGMRSSDLVGQSAAPRDVCRQGARAR
jgi:hypothetical protein